MARETVHPDHHRPLRQPFSPKFATAQTLQRYKSLTSRLCIDQKFLARGSSTTKGAEQILEFAGLLSTVTEVEHYILEVVYEFYANLKNMEHRSDGISLVYVRGQMYEFSPDIINCMFQVECPITDLSKLVIDTTASLDDLATLHSGNTVRRWHQMYTPFVGLSMMLLFKLSSF